MSTSLPMLEQISVPSPCSVPWDSMKGNDAARHCASCNQTVHNLSALSNAEAVAFIEASEDACVRFFKRPDGTVITRDCRETRDPAPRRFLSRVAVFVFSWLGLSLITGCGLCIQGKPANPKKGGQQANPVEIQKDAQVEGEK